MRKLKFITALLLIVALVLTGCGKADDDGETKRRKETTEAQTDGGSKNDKTEEKTTQTANTTQTETETQTDRETGGGQGTEGTDASDGAQQSTESITEDMTQPAFDGLPSDTAVGDIVTFGRYEQDNDLANGSEPIEWEVLDIEDGRALLLSVYALDTVQYSSSSSYIRWFGCTLRNWMNDDFLYAAFTEAECDAIILMELENADNQEYGVDGCDNTYDKVFALSLQDMMTYYGWGGWGSTGEDGRLMKCPTAYVKAKGIETYDSEGCGWWLRSPGENGQSAAYIRIDGGINPGGTYVNNADVAACPALWVKLKTDADDR